jgi:methionyl-tRNA formyltransferase
MNVVFCAYRKWALSVVEKIGLESCGIDKAVVIKTEKDFLKNIEQIDFEIDLIILIGWSWILNDQVISRYNCFGIHPSDLPSFRGGSPLQNQIIRGVVESKVSLMSISSKLDAGNIWLQERLSLSGSNMDEVFDQLVCSCVVLIRGFIAEYPNLTPRVQDLSEGSYYPRRRPSDSRLEPDEFATKSLEELYNFIRCLTDPYPNAYIEDSSGDRLYFTGVKLVRSNSLEVLQDE